jgi:hypothetical protein
MFMRKHNSVFKSSSLSPNKNKGIYTDHANLKMRPTKIFYWSVYAFLHDLPLYILTLLSMGILVTKTITAVSVNMNSEILNIICATSYFYFIYTP